MYNLSFGYMAAVPVLCNGLKTNTMLLMRIYFIYKFSILVLVLINTSNNVANTLLTN